MPNQITLQAAKKLMDKIDNANVPLAVFAAYGSWTATKITTQSFKDQLRLRPNTFVGVYDICCKLEDVAADASRVLFTALGFEPASSRGHGRGAHGHATISFRVEVLALDMVALVSVGAESDNGRHCIEL